MLEPQLYASETCATITEVQEAKVREIPVRAVLLVLLDIRRTLALLCVEQALGCAYLA